jgi:glutathione S-transferase
MMGDTYTIVDMDVVGLGAADADGARRGWCPGFPISSAMIDEVGGRPAAQAVSALREKYKFKQEMGRGGAAQPVPGTSRTHALAT